MKFLSIITLCVILIVGCSIAPNGTNASVQSLGFGNNGVQNSVRSNASILNTSAGLNSASINSDSFSIVQKVLATDGAANDRFGNSVAISGNTAIIGAHRDTSSVLTSGSAYIYTRSNGKWTEMARINASDSSTNDLFGVSVDIDGDIAVVGAYGSSTHGRYSGSAYIFTRSLGTWLQTAKLTPSDAAENDRFGISVAISGNTVIVGASGNDDKGSDSGSAYIFTQSGAGWVQVAKLNASDGSANDGLGGAVDIDGNTAIISADRNRSAGSVSGAAYIFTRSGTTWSESVKLTASDASAGDQFGRSVAVHGSTAIVGSIRDDDNRIDSGSAYIFTKIGSMWTETAKITARDVSAGAQFGRSVDIRENTVIVSAIKDKNAGLNSGSVYIFNREGAQWKQVRKFTADQAGYQDNFGYGVAFDNGTALVGVNSDDDSGNNSGSVYFFSERENTGQEEIVLNIQKVLANDGNAEDTFGFTVAMHGNTAIIGANSDNDAAGYGSGSAYIFTWNGTQWTEEAKLTASDAARSDNFGYWVDIHNDTAIIGAIGDDDNAFGSGAAYIFTRKGTTWTEVVKLKASDAGRLDQFGSAVAIHGNAAVVGAYANKDHGFSSGSAYIFTQQGTTWTETAKLTASDAAREATFGRSVAIDGDIIVVGADGNSSNGKYSGSAYIFTQQGTTWTETAKLTASDASAGAQFGISLAIHGNTAIVGALRGAAYIFTRNGTTWTEEAKLTASDDAPSNQFGLSVGIHDNTVVVGAYEGNYEVSFSRSVYIFTRSGTTWSQITNFGESGNTTPDLFGESVAIYGKTALVGAWGDAGKGFDSGAAYFFQLR